MQIYCPKCHTGYQIDDKLLVNKSRRLRCSSCGEVFAIEDSSSSNPSAPKAEKSAFEALSDMMRDDAPVITVPDEDEPANGLADSQSASDDTLTVTDIEEASREVAEILDTPQTLDEEKSTAEPAMPSEPWLEPQVEENLATATSVIDEETVAETTPEITEPDAQTAVVEPQAEPAAVAEETQSVSEPEDEPVDLEKIFERLSEHTEHLIERERKLPFYERVWLGIKNILGFHFKIKWIYVFIALLVFALLSAFNNRYQIVRKLPFLNAVYKAVGVTAKIPGEGLEFQNISWDFVIDDDDIAKLEIKGFIYNQTNKAIAIPTVHMEILDKDTALLQSQTRDIDEVVEANSKVPLDLIVLHPAPTSKYVYLTFIDKD
jgi:predicted Zn finger-like uncharacterized protein